MKQLFKKADIFLILFLCLAGAALFLPGILGNGNLEALIYENGNITHRIDLSEVEKSYIITLDGPPASTVKVEQNAISYLSSECPDKLCVKAGKLTHRGDTAACLPAKTVIVIEGKSGNNTLPDVITY